jgi:Fe2+ transport system protein B
VSFSPPHGKKLRVLDLPGCYSLRAPSPDEKVAVDALNGELPGYAKPDLVVCVVDASNLERHLQLALQVIELELPTVIALNMVDMAEKAGLRLDPAKLSAELGVPVVPLQASAGKGIIELKQALRFPFPSAPQPKWSQGAEDPEAARREFIRNLCELAARRPDAHQLTLSDRLDHWLLHPFWGLGGVSRDHVRRLLVDLFIRGNPDGLDRSGAGRVGGWLDETDPRRRPAIAVSRWRACWRGRRGGLPASDPAVVLLHRFVREFRLHGARPRS